MQIKNILSKCTEMQKDVKQIEIHAGGKLQGRNTRLSLYLRYALNFPIFKTVLM